MARGYRSTPTPRPPSHHVPFCRNEGLGHPGLLPGRTGGGGERARGGLTFTSQMLMPPSMPVVQNCEHLAFPPLSTEIWLQRGGELYRSPGLQPALVDQPPPGLGSELWAGSASSWSQPSVTCGPECKAKREEGPERMEPCLSGALSQVEALCSPA